ncbi:hypothetical protein L6164_000233 [Bauhinia variegata]|uniref:Uncharacterized protein n=1 Tax=Bauhinia variegata TaxID=167791 RepID=A0ACB9Q8J5_BAUVA|nr:hypothetical protein L6164_000233 [Bauhinia variegata]
MCFPSLLSSLSLFVSLFLAFPSTTTSFDIARVLAQNSSFSTFSNYLTQTQLVSQINNRETITVLVVDNGAMSSISGKSMDFIKKVLSIHVILDYYDVKKLQHFDNKFVQVTTLYQASGLASKQDGFLNITDKENGVVTFASASEQSNGAANLIGSVASEPYNLSVIQVSSLIIPSNLTNSPAHSNITSPPLPSKSPVTIKSPVAPPRSPNAHTPKVNSPSPSDVGAPTGISPAPDGSSKSAAPTNFGLNGAFMILILTFLCALHIHMILPC